MRGLETGGFQESRGCVCNQVARTGGLERICGLGGAKFSFDHGKGEVESAMIERS
jgi:hypothetical protein